MLGKIAISDKFLICILSFLISGVAWGQSAGWSAGISERAVKRESSRWTLQEWMAKKETMRWQDMWLSMNSGSPFEGSLFGVYQSFSSTSDNPASSLNVIANSYGFSAWAQMIGIEALMSDNKDENIQDQYGHLGLRLMGSSIQSSHLILQYGVRTRYIKTQTPATRLNNNYAGLALQIYLQKYFGIEGQYKSLMTFDEPSYGKVKGIEWQANLFIDFKALRIFGGSSLAQDEIELVSGGKRIDKRTGTQGGIKIFF